LGKKHRGAGPDGNFVAEFMQLQVHYHELNICELCKRILGAEQGLSCAKIATIDMFFASRGYVNDIHSP
jgi:hypothetical protein